MDEAEVRIGARVRELREERAMSQVELAKRLQESGHAQFHPTTVSRVEKGERPLRLSEAMALAEVLEVAVDELRPPEPLAEEVDRRFMEYEAVRHAARTAIRDYLSAAEDLRRTIETFREAGVSLAKYGLEDVARWVEGPEADAKMVLAFVRGAEEDRHRHLVVRPHEGPEGVDAYLARSEQRRQELEALLRDSDGSPANG